MRFIALTLAQMEWATIASKSMPSQQMKAVSMFIPADYERKRALFQSFVFCGANEYLLLTTIVIAFANYGDQHFFEFSWILF